jgi:hypothetical protein
MSIDVFAPRPGTPTVVLVDGAFAESSSWNDVVRLLQGDDLAELAESQRFMAARAKSQSVEIGASHAVTVSEPDAVADLILTAVRETQR